VHVLESYGRDDHSFLTFDLDHKWSTSHCGHFTQGKEPQYTINIGDIFQEQIRRVNKNKTYNTISYNVPFLPTYLSVCLSSVCLSVYLSYLSDFICKLLSLVPSEKVSVLFRSHDHSLHQQLSRSGHGLEFVGMLSFCQNLLPIQTHQALTAEALN